MTDEKVVPAAPLTDQQEAEKVYRNLKADHRQIARYIVARCGDFIYDHEREAFIAAFLRAAFTTQQAEIERLRTELHEARELYEGNHG